MKAFSLSVIRALDGILLVVLPVCWDISDLRQKAVACCAISKMTKTNRRGIQGLVNVAVFDDCFHDYTGVGRRRLSFYFRNYRAVKYGRTPKGLGWDKIRIDAAPSSPVSSKVTTEHADVLEHSYAKSRPLSIVLNSIVPTESIVRADITNSRSGKFWSWKDVGQRKNRPLIESKIDLLLRKLGLHGS